MFGKILAALDDTGQRRGSVMLQPTLLLFDASTHFVVVMVVWVVDSDIPSADRRSDKYAWWRKSMQT